MISSNVSKLAELQKRAASSTLAPLAPERDPDTILRDLEELSSEPDLNEVKSLTSELARALSGAEKLTIQVNREKYIRLFKGKVTAPAQFFDHALADFAPTTVSDSAQGRKLAFENPQPWAEPVAGVEVLDDLKEVFQRFVVLEDAAFTALALWVVHSFVFDAAWITPRLAITSPEKRCGKTLVLTLLRHLVAKPLMSANASPAAIFRCVEKFRPTLLIDEADTFLHGKDELRGILNSGHQRDGSVLRTVGDDHEPRTFSTFSPCAIAMIGEIADTLADRAIAVRMSRKKPEERVERLRLDRLGSFEELRRRVLRWVLDARQVLTESDPTMPEELNDRAADNWRALLAIADAVGGEWPEMARRAAAEISSPKGEDRSARILLLEDLRAIFERGNDRLFSWQIIAELTEMEERPWPEWKAGKPITVRQLANLLQPFAIKPRQIRIDNQTAKGYRLEDCQEAFERYLNAPIRNNRNNPLKSKTYGDLPNETSEQRVSDHEAPETLGFTRVVSDVSDREAGSERQSPREAIEI